MNEAIEQRGVSSAERQPSLSLLLPNKACVSHNTGNNGKCTQLMASSGSRYYNH